MSALIRDYSYGIIPLQKVDGRWQSFVVQQTNSYWSFPKGHAEQNESAKESAERELFEETGLSVVAYYPVEPLFVMYKGHGKVTYQKEVMLFCASVQGTINLCPIEVLQGHWIDLEDLDKFIVFDAMQPLLASLKEIVRNIE